MVCQMPRMCDFGALFFAVTLQCLLEVKELKSKKVKVLTQK